MFTYTGDKKPGDLTGNDQYSFVINEGDTVKIADGGASEPATFWRIALP